jgi:hypothetical protein
VDVPGTDEAGTFFQEVLIMPETLHDGPLSFDKFGKLAVAYISKEMTIKYQSFHQTSGIFSGMIYTLVKEADVIRVYQFFYVPSRGMTVEQLVLNKIDIRELAKLVP